VRDTNAKEGVACEVADSDEGRKFNMILVPFFPFSFGCVVSFGGNYCVCLELCKVCLVELKIGGVLGGERATRFIVRLV